MKIAWIVFAFVALALSLGLAALLDRYEIIAHPAYQTQQVYRLDHWTGQVVVMSRTGGTHELGK